MNFKDQVNNLLNEFIENPNNYEDLKKKYEEALQMISVLKQKNKKLKKRLEKYEYRNGGYMGGN